MTNLSKDIVTPTQAAELAGVSRQRIHRLIQVGKLPAQKLGSQYVIPRSIIEKMFHRCPTCGNLDKR